MTTPRKRKIPLFNPDSISTRVYQALCRDLDGASFDKSPSSTGINFLVDSQKSAFLKKYVSESNSDTATPAFEKFRQMNDHIGNVNERLHTYFRWLSIQRPTDPELHEFDRSMFRARNFMRGALGDFCYDEWHDCCSTSPGVTLGVKFSDTSIEAKFTGPLTVTSRAVPHFLHYIKGDGLMTAAIRDLNGLSDNQQIADLMLEVMESRATTVPKTNEIDRVICVEPTLNMFLQQGVMTCMYNRLSSLGLDVAKTPFAHHNLAFEGSITGRLATIDFSSASDCVSIELLRWLLPSEWFDIIESLRSTHCLVNGDVLKLEMISSMGNATTFPLETLVFWALGQAARPPQSKYSVIPDWDNLESISVFGDDCILPTDSAEMFIQYCERVGFIVNKEKSFYDDKPGFRESCGADYLNGYPVRPYYCKAPSQKGIHALEAWCYTIMNGLLNKYYLIFGDLNYIYRAKFILEFVHLFNRYNLKAKIVPDYFPDDSGIKVSGDFSRFVKTFAFDYTPIYRSVHGTYRFNYLTFRYFEQTSHHDHIRYWKKMRFERINVQERIPYKPIRVRGGYLVAAGISNHWFVPHVTHPSA